MNQTHFERCWPWLEAALKREGVKQHTYASLLHDVLTGRSMLWPGDGGAVLTECVIEPDARVVRVWLGGGDMNALLAMRPGVEAWGRAMGCDTMSIEGRKGWGRVLTRFGYRRDGDEFRKAL